MKKADPARFRTKCHAQWADIVFVFMDNSNIFINAQFVGDAPRDLSIRVSVPALMDVVRHGRQPRTQVVVGSRPPATAGVWEAFRKENVTVHLEDRRGGGEQAVDDVLHAQAMRALSHDFGKGKLWADIGRTDRVPQRATGNDGA